MKQSGANSYSKFTITAILITHLHICQCNNVCILVEKLFLRRFFLARNNNLINRRDRTIERIRCRCSIFSMRYLRDGPTEIYENYSQLPDFSRIYARPHGRTPVRSHHRFHCSAFDMSRLPYVTKLSSYRYIQIV